MVIRETTESDFEEVFSLIQFAFGNRKESDLVRRLISDNDVLINLVAESSSVILGNIVVSIIEKTPLNLITKDQLLLFKQDNISSNKYKNFKSLGISSNKFSLGLERSSPFRE